MLGACHQLGRRDVLINDVGDAAEKRVRVVQAGRDLRQAPRGFGVAAATGSALGQLTWRVPNGAGQEVTITPPSGTYLEYQGSGAPGDQVFFLEGVDAVSLDWRPRRSPWQGRWGAWTDFVSFRAGGQDHLLAYDRANGAAQISRPFDGLHGTEAIWQGTWGRWTHLAPCTDGGTDFLLTYNADTGEAMTSRFLPNLNGVETIWSGTWGRWTHLQPFEHEGRPHLLAYDRATGNAQIARFFPGLTGTEALSEHFLGIDATVTALRYPGPPHFVVRQPQPNLRRLYRIYPRGGDVHLVANEPGPAGGAGPEIGTSFRKGRQSVQLSYWPATRDARFTRWTCL